MMKTTDTSSPRSARLADWLWAAGQDLRRQTPPAGRDEAVLAAMQERFGQRQASERGTRWRWSLVGPGLCASVLLACVWLVNLAPPDRDGTTLTRGSDFIVLVSADRWAAFEQAGAANAWLVPTEVPRERLALLGLPYDPATAAEPVHAELLVHASGDVLAMRVMP